MEWISVDEFKMEWISVDEKLPALYVKCLVVSKKTIFIAWQYAGGHWEYGNEDVQYCAYNVTHWMELPPPPKEL